MILVASALRSLLAMEGMTEHQIFFVRTWVLSHVDGSSHQKEGWKEVQRPGCWGIGVKWLRTHFGRVGCQWETEASILHPLSGFSHKFNNNSLIRLLRQVAPSKNEVPTQLSVIGASLCDCTPESWLRPQLYVGKEPKLEKLIWLQTFPFTRL